MSPSTRTTTGSRFGDENAGRLTEVREVEDRGADRIIGAFYQRPRGCESARACFRDSAMLGRVKHPRRKYLSRLLELAAGGFSLTAASPNPGAVPPAPPRSSILTASPDGATENMSAWAAPS